MKTSKRDDVDTAKLDLRAHAAIQACDRDHNCGTFFGVDAIERACELVDPVPLPLARLAFKAGCIGRTANVAEEIIDTLLAEFRSMLWQKRMPDFSALESGIASLLGSRWRQRTLDWALYCTTSVALGPSDPFRNDQDVFDVFRTAVGLMALAANPRMSGRLRAWAVSSLGRHPDFLLPLMYHVQLPASVLRAAFPGETLGDRVGDCLIYQRVVLRDPQWVNTLAASLEATSRADLPRLAMERLAVSERTKLAREYFDTWVVTDAYTADQFFGEFSDGPESFLLTRSALLRFLALPRLDVCTRELIMRRFIAFPSEDTTKEPAFAKKTRIRRA